MRPVDLSLAWVRLLRAAEGTPERMLSDILRKHGASTVCRVCQVDRFEIHRWVQLLVIPEAHSAEVRVMHATLFEPKDPTKPGKIDVAEAVKMREQGEKLEAIGARFGVTKQAVHDAFSRARKRAAKAGDDAA